MYYHFAKYCQKQNTTNNATSSFIFILHMNIYNSFIFFIL